MLDTTLGHFHVIERLGEGGMGVVYRAHDARLVRDVAIKFLSSGVSGDDTPRTRFRSEALALGRLNHPNVGTVHGVGTHDGIDYLVMDLVAGEPLSVTLTRGATSEREIAAIGAQVASALEERTNAARASTGRS